MVYLLALGYRLGCNVGWSLAVGSYARTLSMFGQI